MAQASLAQISTRKHQIIGIRIFCDSMKIHNCISVFTVASFLLFCRHLATDDSDEEAPEVTEEEEDDPPKKSQMQQMQEALQSKEMKEVAEKLKDDPDLKEIFGAMVDGDGQPNAEVLLKYMSDPEVLRKIGQKVGDVPAKAMEGMMPQGGGEPQPPPGGWKCGESIKCSNLLDTASIGDEAATEKFIAEGMDPNEAPEAGRTALHFAAAKGHTGVTSALIKGKANVGALDDDSNTPLHMAAGYGHPEIVALLLDAGAKPEVRNAGGQSPAQVSKLNKNNPVPNDPALMSRLKHDEL